MKRYTAGLLFAGFLFLLGACSAAGDLDKQIQVVEHAEAAVHEDEHTASSDHATDHSAAAHGIPEEAAAVINPVAVSDASVAAGQATYAQYCAACHGEGGEGDGPGAAALDPKPADFHADHVQGLSDGALFYTITHGREGTAMVAWESIISEKQRWEVVNFLRTFTAEHGH